MLKPNLINNRSNLKEDLGKASENLISNCLEVNKDEEVAVIFDPELFEVAESIYYSVLERKAQPILLSVFNNEISRAIREKHGLPLDIPDSVHQLFDSVNVIVTLMEKRIGELPFRAQILKHTENNVTRIAHMPGITKEHFAKYMLSDFIEIKRKAIKIASILEQNFNENMHITTKLGTDLTLKASSNIKISDGIINKPGVLDNLPAGELYFVPENGSANGLVVVDVSIPGHVLQAPNNVIKIPIIEGKADKNNIYDTKDLVKSFLNKSGADILCEVGIGLNDNIDEATGVVLIDEKMGKTAHVAFGDNTFFGGSNRSDVHIDMVMKNPTIKVNSTTMILEGVIS